MKRGLFLLVSLLAAVSVCAQESGNRIYGNNGYYQQRRAPQTNIGSLGSHDRGYAIEASVLVNLKPDAFVVVFGVDEEAPTSAVSNDKVNRKVAEFVEKLRPLGIARNDLFVDFITQNRVYDFSVENGVAIEHLTGFETKKTVAVRYKTREVFEPIVTAAASVGIFDLIKVDYIVTDFERVRTRLFDEAVKVIKDKEAKYVRSLGVALTPVGLSSEKYDVSYPNEVYQRYQAFEASEVSNYTREMKRKSFTFFYDPFEASRFDAVLAPLGIEPAVQFSLYLRMQYDQRKPKEG